MEGKIPIPKLNTDIKRYNISVGDKNMIMTIHQTETSITFYCGNRTVYCIDIQLLKKANGQLYDTGNLTKIRWDRVCSLNDDFRKGTDSIMLLKLLIQYIHNNYSTVVTLRFTDFSTKQCDDGSSINLAALKYLTVGKTWYEEHFGASVDEDSIIFYRELESKIQKKKTDTPWEQLKTVIPVNKLGIPIEELESLYNQSNSWQVFFNTILTKLGKQELCIKFSPWFNNFVSGYLRMSYISLSYCLPVSNIGIDYKISEYKNGGRRRRVTRRTE